MYLPGEPDDENLLPSQKASVGKIITRHGLRVRDFHWGSQASRELSNAMISVLIHVGSSFNFIFDKGIDYQRHYWITGYSPGRELRSENQYVDDWNGVLIILDEWLSYIKREIDAPDLWNEAKKADFEGYWGSSNKPFSEQEIKLVKAQMEQVRGKLLDTAGDDQNLISDINIKIDYLIKSASKMGRKDWAMMAMGYIFNNVANWGLTSHLLQTVLHLIVTIGDKLLPG